MTAGIIRRTRGRRGAARTGDLLIFVGIFILLGIAAFQQHGRLTSLEYRANLYRQRIKIPPAEVLRFITLGYDNVYANWLWLQSIQAFGSGWITGDGTTAPIYLYFDTLTDLDPKFISAYRFANLIIGDNRHDWDLGTRILEKGVLLNPTNYTLPHLGVYNAIWMYDNETEARWFARRLERLEHAPGFMRRMSEYIERQSGRFEAAYTFNARYYLEYVMHNNDLERQIVVRRLQDLLDRWYRRELGLAAQRYFEEHGHHPEFMEQLLNAEYLPPYEAPTMLSFRAAIDAAITELEFGRGIRGINEDLMDRVTASSMERIVGLPPEPKGYWYLIHEPNAIYHNEGNREVRNWEDVQYIVSAWDLVDETNRVAIGAQSFIMGYFNNNNGAKPSDESMSNFLGRDPLGGRYVYQRDAPESPTYGVFFSSAARRIMDQREPRMGLRGPGPFPFTLMPRLSENAEDRAWGIEKGYIDEHGNEIWFLPGEEPWIEREEPEEIPLY